MRNLVIAAGAAALAASLYVLATSLWVRTERPASPSHLNAEYAIGAARVRLVDGLAETPAAPGSAATILTRYFGNELRKDLNGDGTDDVAFILTQQTGGSGVFYYVVAALDTEAGFRGSKGLLIGDRIAPQSIESGPGRTIHVNYADRAPGDAFSVRPSIAKTLRVMLDPTTLGLGEVVADFEGEADPARMTLDMTAWRWIRTAYADGREVTPASADRFVLTLSRDGRFTATTDCNTLAGAYTTRGDAISLQPVASTRMYCDGSQEAEFAANLRDARSYRFTPRGELVLTLGSSGGTLVLR